ncbi:hypothetical protein OROMI_004786 [Orobanche minor]
MERQNKLLRVISGLPQDMIEEILSRLPVKSLLRFRCVSKVWHSLIGSKSFMRKQLKNSKRNTSFAQQKALLLLREEPFNFSDCSLSSLFHKPDFHAIEFNFASHPIYSLRLVGSSNGLVCILLNHEEFVLWNPSTRRISKKLPLLPNMDKRPHTYGFGCDDEWSDDYNYKVVVIFVNEDYSAVYTSKSDSWRIIWNNPWSFSTYFVRRGKLKSGKLQWEFWELRRKGESFCIDFDLKREVFENVEKEALDGRDYGSVSIDLDESSHVLRTYPSKLAACAFTNIQKLRICDYSHYTSAHVILSMYDFEIYLESLETPPYTYPQQGEEALGIKQ